MGVQGAAAGIYSAAVFSALVTFSTTSSTAAAMARYVCRGWYLLTISPTIGRTTLSVLATLPIFYAICMRNHRIIIGNVAAAPGTSSHFPPQPHNSSHNFISFSNTSNILRYLCEKPPHNNRKCGWRSASVSGWNLLPIIIIILLYFPPQLRQFGNIFNIFLLCMEEHTCEAKLPHEKGNVRIKQGVTWDKGFGTPRAGRGLRTCSPSRHTWQLSWNNIYKV